jgi:hypothetical protein
MWKALFVKELRQSLWITLPTLAAYVVFILEVTRVSILPSLISGMRGYGYGPNTHEIPFVGDQIPTIFGIITGLFATTLGLWQALGEAFRGTDGIQTRLGSGVRFGVRCDRSPRSRPMGSDSRNPRQSV